MKYGIVKSTMKSTMKLNLMWYHYTVNRTKTIHMSDNQMQTIHRVLFDPSTINFM